MPGQRRRMRSTIRAPSSCASPARRIRQPVQASSAANGQATQLKLARRLRAGEDEDRAQDQRDQDAPEQDPRLLLARHRQRREDQREHEDVVERQRLLHHVAGEERAADLGALERPQARAEEHGERDPDGAPHRGPPQRHRTTRRADRQVDHHHHGQEGDQAGPQQGTGFDGLGHVNLRLVARAVEGFPARADRATPPGLRSRGAVLTEDGVVVLPFARTLGAVPEARLNDR